MSRQLAVSVFMRGALVAAGVVAAAPASAGPTGDMVFTGICDGSAAIALGGGSIAVANDEDNIIRTYVLDGDGDPRPGSLLGALDVMKTRRSPKTPEFDIEGAVRIEDHIFWIGSHGRDNDGDAQPARQVVAVTTTALKLEAMPYTDLVPALLREDRTWHAGLDEAVGKEATQKKLAPERAGLNIEAIAYMPAVAGTNPRPTALIGLRNPAGTGDAAMLLPLQNLETVVAAGDKPAFARPVMLPLDGLGVRDLAWSEQLRSLIVLAGPRGAGSDFRLYRWSGAAGDAPVLLTRIEGLRPEAVVTFPTDSRVLLLSDDGDAPAPGGSAWCGKKSVKGGGCRCKDIKAAASHKKSFRGRWLAVE